MGLFSGKKTTHVITVTERMLDDASFKYSSQYAIAKWLQTERSKSGVDLSGEGLPDYLLDFSNNAMPRKWDRFYHHCKKSDNYIFGLPKASNVSKPRETLEKVVAEYLKNTYGEINIDYIHIGVQNFFHVGWERLVRDYNYDSQTNKLIIQGVEYYLADAKLQLTKRSFDEYVELDVLEGMGVAYNYNITPDRDKDINRDYQDIELSDTDKLIITYLWQEKELDDIPPNQPIINTYATTYIDGFSEFDSIVIIKNNGNVYEVSADEQGYFKLNEPLTGQLEITVKDAKDLVSEPLIIEEGYVNDNPVDIGTDGYILINHTDEFSIDLSDVNPEHNFEQVDNPDDISDTTVTPSTDTIPEDYDYIQVGYSLDGNYHWFSYAYLSGLIPELDNALLNDKAIGEYYPRLYTRINDINIVNHYDKQKKEDGIKASKKLGIDLKDLTIQLNNSVGDEIKNVHYMYLTLAIGVNTNQDDKRVSEYLYRYFDRLLQESDDIELPDDLQPIKYVTQTINGKEEVKQVPNLVPHKSVITQYIQDNILTVCINYNKARIITHQGKLHEVGSYWSSVGSIQKSKTKNILNIIRRTIEWTEYYHSFFYQTNENEYTEIRIFGLSKTDYYSGHSSTVSGTDEKLCIPLDKSIVMDLTLKEREILINKAFQVQINIIKVIKQKWYQRGIFRVLLAVIAIAITVATKGAGLSWASKLFLMAKTMAISFAVNIAVDLVAKLAVKLGVSPEVLGIITLIATIAIGAMSGSFDASKLLRADTIMAKLNHAFKMYQKAIQHNIAKIQKELAQLAEYYKNKQKEVAKAQELLNTGVVPIDLELLLNPPSSIDKGLIILGETPTEFYNRTTTINVVEITQAIASNFVSANMVIEPVKYKPTEDFDINEILLIK